MCYDPKFDGYLVNDTFSVLSDISQQPLTSVDLPLDLWMGLYAADFFDYVFFDLQTPLILVPKSRTPANSNHYLIGHDNNLYLPCLFSLIQVSLFLLF